MGLEKIKSALGFKEKIIVGTQTETIDFELFTNLSNKVINTDNINNIKNDLMKYLDTYKNANSRTYMKEILYKEIIKIFVKNAKTVCNDQSKVYVFLLEASNILQGLQENKADSLDNLFTTLLSTQQQEEYKTQTLLTLKNGENMNQRDYIGKYKQAINILGITTMNIEKETYKENISTKIVEYINNLEEKSLSMLFYNKIDIPSIRTLLSKEESTKAVLQGFQELQDKGLLDQMPVFEYTQPDKEIIEGIKKIVKGVKQEEESTVQA